MIRCSQVGLRQKTEIISPQNFPPFFCPSISICAPIAFLWYEGTGKINLISTVSDIAVDTSWHIFLPISIFGLCTC